MEKGGLSYGDAIGSQKMPEEGVLITCPLHAHSILQFRVMGVTPGHACISAKLHSRGSACLPSAAQQLSNLFAKAKSFDSKPETKNKELILITMTNTFVRNLNVFSVSFNLNLCYDFLFSLFCFAFFVRQKGSD